MEDKYLPRARGLWLSPRFSAAATVNPSTELGGQVATQLNACRIRIREKADLMSRAADSILKSLGLT